MRIRRSSELSPALSTANGTCPEELLQAHVCLLNQSPWDVAIDAQSLSPYAQIEGRNGQDNGSSQRVDSVAAVESITSSMVGTGAEAMKVPVKRGRRKKKKTKKKTSLDQTVGDDNGDGETGAVRKSKNMLWKRSKPGKCNDTGKGNGKQCQKNDGKGWQCKRDAKHDFDYCEHHLSQFRSYNAGTGTGTGTATPELVEESKPAGMTTRGAPKRPNSNPYHYYGRITPRKSRRRGAGQGTSPNTATTNGDSGEKSGEASSSTTTVVDRNAPANTGEVGFIDYEDDEDSDGDDGNRKRVRRPVKARSLKSLM